MTFALVRGRARLPEGFKEHVESRLQSALDRFEDHLVAVSVRVDDLNGPKGGTDQFCQVRVRVRGASEIVAEDRSSDLLAAVDRAIGRAQFAVARAIERLHVQSHRR